MPRFEEHIVANEVRSLTLLTFVLFILCAHLVAALAIPAVGILSAVLPDVDYAPPRHQRPAYGRRRLRVLLRVRNTMILPIYTMLVGAAVLLPFMKISGYGIVGVGLVTGLLIGISLVTRVVHRGWFHSIQAGILLSFLNALAVANFCDYVFWVGGYYLWDLPALYLWTITIVGAFITSIVGYHAHLRLDGAPLTKPRPQTWVVK